MSPEILGKGQLSEQLNDLFSKRKDDRTQKTLKLPSIEYCGGAGSYDADVAEDKRCKGIQEQNVGCKIYMMRKFK